MKIFLNVIINVFIAMLCFIIGKSLAEIYGLEPFSTGWISLWFAFIIMEITDSIEIKVTHDSV